MGAKIVVGTDGSDSSRHALRWAADEAVRRDASLVVVTVWQYPTLTTMPAFGVLPPADEMNAEAEAGLRQLLADEGLTGREDLSVYELVQQGPAASALLDAAADADLLVVGSRGHGGFTGLLLGSVSQAVVSHARCPVVVVPNPDSDDS
jgi:nucleotide-binding universal stress UspA family protein